MKKLLIVLFAFALLFGSANVVKSQVADGYVSFVGATVTDTETDYLAVTSPIPIQRNYAITITVISTTGSATATVTATPQGSQDNSTWFDLEAAATVNNAGTSTTKVFVYPNAYLNYYRVKLSSTGTGVTSLTGKLGLKRN